MLRFWETRFSHIRPLKRGGGRRYYRPDDVLLLKGIRHLLYDQGFTIKGVQRILKEQGARQVIAVGESGSLDALSTPAPTEPQAELPPPDAGVDAPQAVEPLAHPAVSATAPRGLTRSQREGLSEVLRDLLECKRSLDRAREG